MKRWTQIIKGILFVGIGLCFFRIRFYDINSIINMDGFANGVVYAWIPSHFASYFNEFFKQNGLNLIVSLLFIAVGVLELIQVKGMKSNANNQ